MHRGKWQSSCTKDDWEVSSWKRGRMYHGDQISCAKLSRHESAKTLEEFLVPRGYSTRQSGEKVAREVERGHISGECLKVGWWATMRSSKDDSFGTCREMNSCSEDVKKVGIWVKEIQSPSEARRLWGEIVKLPEGKWKDPDTFILGLLKTLIAGSEVWWIDTADCYKNLLLSPVHVSYLLGAGRVEFSMFCVTVGLSQNRCCLWAWTPFLGQRDNLVCSLFLGQHGAWRSPLPCPPVSVLRFRHLFGKILWTHLVMKTFMSINSFNPLNNSEWLLVIPWNYYLCTGRCRT